MKSIGFLEELQRQVVARHKTETRRLTDPQPDDYLLNPPSFQMAVAQTFWPAVVSFVPDTKSAKLSTSKNRMSTTLIPTEYSTNMTL